MTLPEATALVPITDKLEELNKGDFNTLTGLFEEQPLFNQFTSISGVQEACSKEAVKMKCQCMLQHKPEIGKFYIQFAKI